MLTEQLIQHARDGNIQAIRNWFHINPNHLNDTDNDNDTLLAIAILNNQWELTLDLLEQNVNANIQINNSPQGPVNAINIPMQYGRWDVVAQLIRAGANPRDYDKTDSPLNYFAKENNINMINYILDNYDNIVNYPPHHSPLKVAAIAGHLNIVQVLVNAGAAIDHQESLDGKAAAAQDKFTPIQCAAMFGHNDIVNYLMSLAQYRSEYADLNMGFSFDWFETRLDYNVYTNMDQVVESILPHPRQAPATEIKDKRALRADLLILQATTKYYTLRRAVPKITRQGVVNKYLDSALLALYITQHPTSHSIAMQKMAFSWFCTSIATYAHNCNPRNVDAAINHAQKTIGYLGQMIDCRADQGYFHYTELIRTDVGAVFDTAFRDILENLAIVRDFIEQPNDETLRAYQETLLYKLSAYINDCEQLSKLQSSYCCFNEADLRSNNPDRIEAALNVIANTLEIVKRLSKISRAYFHDLDFDSTNSTLSNIRNHLRHVNGNQENHNAFNCMSRARRYERLVNGQNPLLMSTIIHFMKHDVAELQARIEAYSKFIKDINNPEMLNQKFRISTSQIDYLKNSLWCYYNFFNYHRNSESLHALLKEHDDNNYPEEDIVHRHLRTTTQIEALQTIIINNNYDYDDNSLRGWNRRVKTALGINRRYIRDLPQAQREQARAIVRRVLPTEENQLLDNSKKIHCYLRHAANIHYAMTTLQRIIYITTTKNQMNSIILRNISSLSLRSSNLSEEEKEYYKTLYIEHKRNIQIRDNVVEWQVVHFYEHVCSFVRNQIFLKTYGKQHGNTKQLLLDIEQIRNYIAHVANLRFANNQGLATNQDQLFDLCRHAESILQGFQRVQQTWQALLAELIAIIPPAHRQIIENQPPPLLATPEEQQNNRLTTAQLLARAGIFGAAAVAIGAGYYFRKDFSVNNATVIPKR